MFSTYYKSPIGLIKISSTHDSIVSLSFVEKKDTMLDNIPEILNETVKQLDEYFKGLRKEFNLKLKLEGTNFQNKVWYELTKIPYGEVVSYGYIAKSLGNKNSSRAVGNANNKNKIAIIVPCHRVIGSNGKLIGYAGGIDKKEWLLKHETKNK
jgi:methylated-DNA-[protein]-cysteine S-methyltransferase